MTVVFYYGRVLGVVCEVSNWEEDNLGGKAGSICHFARFPLVLLPWNSKSCSPDPESQKKKTN